MEGKQKEVQTKSAANRGSAKAYGMHLSLPGLSMQRAPGRGCALQSLEQSTTQM